MSNERVMSPKFRVAFAKVFTPDAENDKYSLAMLFDNNTDISELKELVKNVVADKYGNKVPKKFMYPFKDGNEQDTEAYPFFKNQTIVNASTKFKIGLVDEDVNPIIDQSEFYNGCYARATLSAYCWEFKGKAGVSFNVQNVQKVGDGERLGGAVTAEQEFEAVERQETSGFDI